jgi:mannosyltransferase
MFPAKLFLPGGLVLNINGTYIFLLLPFPVLIIGLNNQYLGYDEIFSATYSVQSLFDVIISTLRFDAHPPLYYLQLHIWGMISQKTSWLLLNSMFFTVLSIFSIFYISQRLLCESSAAIAAALYGIMPATVLYAHTLRMYAMLTFLAIWIAFFTRRLSVEPQGRHSAVLLVVAGTAASYSHATGILIAAYGGIYGLLLIIEHHPPIDICRRWLAANVVIATISVPAVADSIVRSTAAKMPAFNDLTDTLVYLFAGAIKAHMAVAPFTLMLCTAVTIGGVLDRRTRALALAFLVFPFGTAFFHQPPRATHLA